MDWVRATNIGFGYYRPSFRLLVLSIVVYTALICAVVFYGHPALAFHPVLIVASVTLSSAPSHIFTGPAEVVVLFFAGEKIHLWALLLAFVASVPVSLWAMAEAEKGEEITTFEFSLSLREALKQPLYRTLFLFHFGSLSVAARNYWIPTLCDLSGMLGHFTTAKIVFDCVYGKLLHEPFQLGFLESCLPVSLVTVGIGSFLMVERRARELTVEARSDNAY